MANSDKNIRITTSKNKTTYPNIVFTGSAAGSSVITLEVLDDNTLSFTSNEGQVFSIDSNLSTGTIWAVSDISGIPLLSASAGGTIGLGVYGGVVGIGQTNPTYKLDLKGNFGLASTNDGLYNFIFSNSAASGSNSLQIRSANSILLYNSGNTFYTGLKSNAAANVTYTLPTTDGSADQFLKTNGSGALSWGTPAGGSGGGGTGVGAGGQYEVAVYPSTGSSVVGYSSLKNDVVANVVSISHSTVATNHTNGALTVTGGVGIGGSLYVAGIGASITGVTFSNSTITRGTWNGTAIATQYGGTGQNLSSSTGILTISSGTVSASTTSSAISSALSDETGSGFLVFNTQPSFGTGVTTGDATFAVFNTNATTINAFGAATTISLGAATGTATLNSTTNSTSISTGAFVIKGGAGIANTLFVGGMIRVGSNTYAKSYSLGDIALDNGSSADTPAITYYWGNNTNLGTDVYSDGVGSTRYRLVYNLNEAGGREIFTVDAVGNLRLYTSTGANYIGFRFTGSATTAYTLPATSPATGTSVLQSTSDGIMSWVPMVASSSSAGSGTVATPGAQYQVAAYYFSATGASVSGSTTFTNNTATGVVNITHSTVSTSSSTGAFTVSGGVGIGGSVFTSTSVPSSISGVVLSNGLVTTGTWSGSTITAFYGGTGLQGPVAIGDLIVANTTSTWTRLTVGATSGHVLTSNGSNAQPTWQAVPPAAASSVAVIPTTLNQSFFVTAVSSSNGSGLGLSTIVSFVVNPSTNIVSLSGLAVTSTTISNSTSTGALVVSGGAGIAGSLFTGTGFSSSISGVVFANGFVTVGNWQASAISPAKGGTGQDFSASSGILKYTAGTASVVAAPSGAIVGTTDSQNLTNKTYNNVTITAPATNATLTLADTTTLATSGAFNLTLTTTATTNVTFPSGTKTLVATDVTSLSSLTTASSLNSVGTISSGTWSASAITSFYGGTGHATYTNGDLLVGSGGTVAKLPAGATNFVLTSNGAGTVPSWQAVPASSASSVAVIPTTLNQSFFMTAVSASSGSGLGLSTIVSFVVNPSTGIVSASGLAVTSTTASTSTSTGALIVSGGAGVALTLNVGGTISSIGASIYGPLYTNNIQIGQGGNNINFLDAAGATLGNFNTSNGWFRSAQTTNSSSTSTGALVSAGGLGVASNAFIGGTVNITSSQTSIASNNGALVVTGGVGIGGSLYTSAGSTSSVSGVILANGNVSATTYNRLTLTTPATSATLTLANGSSLITSGANSLTLTTTATSSVTMPTAGTLTTTGNKLSVFAATTSNELLGVISDETGSGLLVFNTSPDFTTSVTTGSATFSLFNTNATTINALQAGTAISLGAATGTITLNNAITLHNQTTASTSPTTGAIVVNGGVGIGLSASIGGRLQLFNGANFTAFISAATANTVYTLPPTSPATGSSVLQSTSAGVMSWVPMTAGGGPSGTINSSTINNIAYYTGSTTLSGDTLNSFYYNSASNGLVIANPDNETTSSANTGLLRIGTGATNYAVRKALAVFSTNNAWTDGDLLVLGLGNALANQRVAIDYRGYIQIGVPGTGFTLPVTNGTSGQVLTANTNGVASWTTVSGSSGAGSGTVAIPGAQYQVAAYYHSATGASVSGSTTFTNNTATGVVNITHTTESTSTTTGALTVSGGAGFAKTVSVGQIKIGSLGGYNATNVLGAFQSSVDGYNQVIVQNTNSGASASANFIVNNNLSTDSTYYGEFGMNSSAFSGSGALSAPNAVYLASATGPLVLGTVTSHPIRIVVNNGATDLMYFAESGLGISVFTNLGMRSQSDLRFWNSGNTFYSAIQGGNHTANYVLTMPVAPVGAGYSTILVDTSGNMFFAPVGSGLASTINNASTPFLRARRAITIQFCAGYTPTSAGADSVTIKVPQSAVDGVTDVTYRLREFDVRVETPSSGPSRLQLEKYTGTSAFAYAATGTSLIGGFGVTLTGAAIYTTSVSTATFAGSFVTSNDKLRLNWTLLNATHANFSVQLTLEEV